MMCNVVTLPESIIKQIDGIVGESGRDQFVLDVLEAEFRRRRVEAFEAIVGSLGEVGIPEWETRESADRWVREQRREWDKRVDRLWGGEE